MELIKYGEEKIFSEGEEAKAFFAEQKAADTWLRHTICTRTATGVVEPVLRDVENAPILIEEIMKDHGWTGMFEQTIKDCMTGTGLSWRTADGELPVRDTALESIFGRAGIRIESRAARLGIAGNRKKVSDILNTGLSILAGHDGKVEGIELVRDGMITAVNSDGYEVLPMADLMAALEEVLSEDFPGWQLCPGGTVSHAFAKVVYTLGERSTLIIEELNRVLARVGYTTKIDGTPFIMLTTSDCYSSGANLYPYVNTEEGAVMMIGAPLRHPHIKGNDLDKFREKCGQVYALMRDATEGLGHLAEVTMSHPVAALENAAEAAGLSKRAARDVVEEFDLTRPPVCTALDVYMALWHVETKTKGSENLIAAHENIARLLKADWRNLDAKRA